MKKIVSYLLVSIFSISCFAQVTHYISIGPELGIPGKNMSGANIGFGGSLEYQVKFNAPIGIQLHTGYNQFSNKSSSSEKINFLSARLGLSGFIYEDIIFLMADGGISQFHSNTTGTRKSGSSFSFGGGYHYPIGNNQFMQLSIFYTLNSYKYNRFGQSITNNYNWFTIRAAFGLQFGKRKPFAGRVE